MRTDDFDFDLPSEVIAQEPANPRDAARLLEIGPEVVDRRILDLPDILQPGDILVLNDTRVLPTRLRGRRGDASIEITLHHATGPYEWRAFARPARRLRPGDRILMAEDLVAEVIEKREAGEFVIRLDAGENSPIDALHRHGEMPLPPYIRRRPGGNPDDYNAYQTIYAAKEGAVAAPTAGLHFTEQLFSALDARGILRVFLTLHVGAGTFLPIKTDELSQHRMHAEWGTIGSIEAERINAARDAGGRIVAVGSTSLRLMESAASVDGTIMPFEDETDLFIVPGYRFRTADLFLTNFHLPRSTLFVLVSAFSGLERMKAAYEHAIANGYRFYSYGDACLLHRTDTA